MIDTLLNVFFSIFLVAVIVERCTEFLFEIKFLKDFDKSTPSIPFKKLGAIIIGLIIAFTSKLDIISLILLKNPTVIGYFLTGILFAGGANLISNVLKTYTEYKEKMMK